MKQQFESVRSGFLLLLAAFIWGIAFVAQSVGMDYMGPCTFNAARFLIGGVVLLPVVIWTKERMEAKRRSRMLLAKKNKSGALLPGGVCCGIALCAASLLQQFGIRYTSVGKAGFLTTLYIVIVPLLGIFVRRIPGVKVWCSVVAALMGCISMYFRKRSDELGDALVIGCAFAFSIHILVVDHFAEQVDGVKLSCLQFLTSGVICLVLAFLTEHPSWDALFAGIVPVLYAGVLSSGVGYTLQVVGQKSGANSGIPDF